MEMAANLGRLKQSRSTGPIVPLFQLALALILFSGVFSGARAAGRNLLLLYSYGNGSQGMRVYDEGLLATLYANGITVNDLYFEYLDLERNKTDAHYLADTKGDLERKYPKGKIDLVITVQQPARNFLLKEGALIAPSAPVISIQSPPPAATEVGERRFISLLAKFDVKGTLELALKLFPETKRVVVAVGSSDADKGMAAAVAQTVLPWKGQLEFEYTTDLTLDQLLARVASLDRNTIILFTQFNKDAAGQVTIAYEVEGKIAKAANAPVFGLYDFNLRNGGIGGSVISVLGLGEYAARLALDILDGKRVLTRPVTLEEMKVTPIFEWSQLERWGAKTAELPKEAVILNYRPGIWEEYKGYLLAALSLLLLQAALIAALIINKRQRERAELLLTESEERFRALFEQAADSILLLEPVENAPPVIREANSATFNLLGYEREELIGKSIAVLDPNPFAPERGDALSAGGLSVFEVAHRTKAGELRDFECVATLIRLGGKEMILSAERDITDRKIAEAKLKESEERVRAIFEAAPLGIGITRGGRQIVVNGAFAEMFGYPSADAVKNAPIVDHLIPEVREEVVERMKRREEGGQSVGSYELMGLRQDQTTFPFMVYATAIRLADGPATLAFFRDLTKEKASEAERTKLQNQLFQAQKVESIGKLAGGVAHDFNNMLGVIIGHAELALENAPPTGPLREDIGEILNAARRSAEITRQLLAFARKQTIAPRVLDLNATLSEMLKMIQRLIGEDINLCWKPGSGLWRVRIDPVQVDQLAANLATNARDAIAGGGRLTIETLNAALDDAYCARHPGATPGEYVILSVSDSGCGMAAEQLSRIFDPFFTTKELGKGTGLGLATVYGIVKQNGGFINVYSEPGVGTTFTIHLPRAEAALSAPEKARTLSLGTGTIILVEDEQANLKLGRRLLESLGYRVLATDDPAEAIRLTKEGLTPIDLLITDVVMPGMNGRELAETLGEIQPGLKCLFVSGYTADVIAHRGVLGEGVNFLQKPYSLSDLSAKVRTVLAG